MARPQAAEYEMRQQKLIDSAARLFSQKGFHAASMADLAEACRIPKSLIYHYFPAKEDLLEAAVSSHIDVLVEEVESQAQRGLEPRAHLRSLVHAFMGHYLLAADRQKVLLNELKNLPTKRRKAIVAKQRKIIEAVQLLLTEIHPQLKDQPQRARVEAMLLFGMINWTHNWFDPRGPVSPDALADMVADKAIAPL